MVADNLLCYINESLKDITAQQYKIPVSTIDSHDIVKYGVSPSGKKGIFVYSEGYEAVEVYFFSGGTKHEDGRGWVHFSELFNDFMVVIARKTQDDGYVKFRTLVYTGDVWFELYVRNPRYFKGLLEHDHFIHRLVPPEYTAKELRAIAQFTDTNEHAH